ncbi:MAG TPA: PHB depolymerase family esterase [Fervidobacterium sp.]|nr:phospholipase [Fervidobacterium sp.]HOQ39336.1 PHB depolymerase family esterase [Fervidobacterium sp.]HPZ17659.1 PHB depolymerase family esterase [Fervidobacterium sp.]HQE48699.1 PHB depolymerase family esterase [Fervidobacterium sp.]HRD19879.1 PHB depolymerase family esterase [Fervidobacterium sp.]
MAEKDYLECFKSLTYQDEFITMPYRLFEPEIEDGERYPLVVFLHGVGQRGNDNEAQITANEGATIWATDEVQKDHPCFVLAPQCPDNAYWGLGFSTASTNELSPNSLLATVAIIIDSIIDKHPVDTDRIYITGLSMGGFGAITLLTLHPEKFAAGVIMCGGGNAKRLLRIKHVPLWLFHAEDDDVVPVDLSREVVEILRNLGAKEVKYTEYPKGYMNSLGLEPHESWVPGYRTKGMVKWLFEKRRYSCSH